MIYVICLCEDMSGWSAAIHSFYVVIYSEKGCKGSSFGRKRLVLHYVNSSTGDVGKEFMMEVHYN